MAWWRRRREIACQRVIELLTDYLEGALAEPERRRLDTHLNACRHCHEYLAQLRATIEACGVATPEELRPEVKDELITLYRGWLAQGPDA